MSTSQNNQRLRRNGSPSTKQGPIRATQQFALTSPSRGQVRRSPPSSPAPKESGRTRNRPLSETGLVTDRRSPSSPSSFKIVEKPKAVIGTRSNSFDNVMAAPYLSGQWPKDGHWQQQKDASNSTPLQSTNTGAFTSDKQTQTPEEWIEPNDRRRSGVKLSKSRSQSAGNGDQQLKNIKHILQRNGGQTSTSPAYQQRLSPVLPVTLQTGSSPSSMPIKIPNSTSNNGFTAPRGTPGKARGSVEGLNQEVEKLIISGRKLDANESAFVNSLDGHRAPITELLSQTRNVDTQTPSYIPDSVIDPLPIMLEVTELGERSSSPGSDENSNDSSGEESERSRSVSPSFIPGQFELEDPILLEQNDYECKMTPSPRPNSEFMRLPPDGAEKIKIMDEMPRIIPSLSSQIRIIVPSNEFKTSATSAFQSINLSVMRKS